MNVLPDLLLVFYDHEPTNKTDFLTSLLKNLKISVSPSTRIYCYLSRDANRLQETLVDATVRAVKLLQEQSLKPDMDSTIYQNYQSYSSHDSKLIRGHIFQIFASTKQYSSDSLGDRLHVGMS